MNHRNTLLVTSALFGVTLSLFGVQAQAAGDAAAGAGVFNEECADCHSMKEGKNKKGPSLFGVMGRRSGSIADYEYSAGMKAANLIWTEEQISGYIGGPKAIVPTGKMKYDGLVDAQARADVIAFLGK